MQKGLVSYQNIKLNDIEKKINSPGRRIGLFIGINKFEQDEWRPLKFASKDAMDMAKMLENPNVGGFQDVKVLTTSAETRKRNILLELEQILWKNTSPDDTVLIYISSHGTLAHDEKKDELNQYIVTYETRQDEITTTALELNKIKHLFSLLPSRKKVLILAFCYSGSGKSGLNSSIKKELEGIKTGFFVKPLESVSEASVILSASAWGETAREDESLQNDVYTHYFIEALQKFDRNDDGTVTVSEAHDYAKQKTYYFTKGKQRPTAISDILGSDPIILAGKNKKIGKPVIYGYNDKYSNMEVSVEKGAVVQLPGAVAVNEGAQKIALYENGKQIYNNEIFFKQGERLSVDELLTFGIDNSFLMKIGYQSLIDKNAQERIIQPLQLVGLEYNYLWNKQYHITFDTYFGNADQNLKINNQDYSAYISEISTGIGMAYKYSGENLYLSFGPRINGLYIKRKFRQSDYADKQDFFNVSLGITGRLGYMLSGNFNVSLEQNYSYLTMEENNKDNNLWFKNLFFNIAWNF